MKCEQCNPKYRPLFESVHWRVHLAPDQAYLGRCVVVLKRHAGTLAMLTSDEWKDFGLITKRLEIVLTKAFEPQLFNWTCMMNDTYLTDNPDPHIHWHVRPRYEAKATIAGVTFEDPEFGKHYDRERKKDVSDDVRRAIREQILHYA